MMRLLIGVLLVSVALSAAAWAQTDQKPAQAGGQSKLQTETGKPASKFNSPITGKDKSGTKEAEDFTKLVKLYEEREAARCDPAKRGKLFAATIAYRDAEFAYIRDYSPNYYTGPSDYEDEGSGPSEADVATAKDSR